MPNCIRGPRQLVYYVAEDARLKPSAALMVAAAVTWMRMLSCSLGCYKLLRRSGMLQRCMHVLHTILAACPATPPVCIAP